MGQLLRSLPSPGKSLRNWMVNVPSTPLPADIIPRGGRLAWPGPYLLC